MPDTLSPDMQWLLEFAQGKRWPYSHGLVTYEHQELHQACLALERQGYLVRHEDGLPGVAWLPVLPPPDPTTPEPL
jgi:hypothetical protein